MKIALRFWNAFHGTLSSSALGSILILTVFWGMVMGEPVFAEETPPPEFPDRLKLYGGYQLLFGLDATLRLDGADTGFGSTIDLVDDLGVDEDDNMLRAGARFRFNENHAIGFSWYDISLHGNRILENSLEIDDDIFLINSRAKTKIDLTLYRLYYNWSFYRSEKTELLLSPGMYFGDFEAKFKGSAVVDAEDILQVATEQTVKENLFAPLPTLGLAGSYKIFPRLTAHARTDFFYVNIGEIEGSIAEFYFGLEYRIFKHFGVGAAFDRIMLDLEYKKGKPKGWELGTSWSSGLFYGAIYF
ncbi:MAG: hypothetical protein KIT39_10970 [Nitrospirales bacterium]|nr:hypothetical protein [Nitrospirales bacterium]